MKLSNFLLFILAACLLSIASVFNYHQVNNKIDLVLTAKPDKEKRITVKLSDKLSDKLSKDQIAILILALDIARKDGHKDPRILQAIVYQETKAGAHPKYKVAGQSFGLSTNHRYYGLCQIKASAAKDVLKRWPNLKTEFRFQTDTDEELISKLIENDKFNLSIASKYLLLMKDYGFHTMKQVALAYNQGPGGAKNFDSESHPYSTGIIKNIKIIYDI